MFTFGEQLYRTTTRDEETLLVEPMFRTAELTLAGGTATGQLSMSVPVDRMLFIHSINAEFDNSALRVWTQFRASIFDRFGTQLATLFNLFNTAGLVGDANVAASGAGGLAYLNRRVGLVAPPGAAELRINVNSSTPTNPGTFRAATLSYLIPPGRFGRA